MKFSTLKITSLLCILYLMAACSDSTSNVQPKLDQEFKIKFEQTLTLANETVTIQFNQLLNDSRCPKGIMCVWAGNAKIQLLVNETSVNLNTNNSFQTEAVVSDYKIKLISLAPYPDINNPTTKKNYRAVLLVTKVE